MEAGQLAIVATRRLEPDRSSRRSTSRQACPPARLGHSRWLARPGRKVASWLPTDSPMVEHRARIRRRSQGVPCGRVPDGLRQSGSPGCRRPGCPLAGCRPLRVSASGVRPWRHTHGRCGSVRLRQGVSDGRGGGRVTVRCRWSRPGRPDACGAGVRGLASGVRSRCPASGSSVRRPRWVVHRRGAVGPCSCRRSRASGPHGIDGYRRGAAARRLQEALAGPADAGRVQPAPPGADHQRSQTGAQLGAG
jgi:hypothetical protein